MKNKAIVFCFIQVCAANENCAFIVPRERTQFKHFNRCCYVGQ